MGPNDEIINRREQLNEIIKRNFVLYNGALVATFEAIRGFFIHDFFFSSDNTCQTNSIILESYSKIILLIGLLYDFREELNITGNQLEALVYLRNSNFGFPPTQFVSLAFMSKIEAYSIHVSGYSDDGLVSVLTGRSLVTLYDSKGEFTRRNGVEIDLPLLFCDRVRGVGTLSPMEIRANENMEYAFLRANENTEYTFLRLANRHGRDVFVFTHHFQAIVFAVMLHNTHLNEIEKREIMLRVVELRDRYIAQQDLILNELLGQQETTYGNEISQLKLRISATVDESQINEMKNRILEISAIKRFEIVSHFIRFLLNGIMEIDNDALRTIFETSENLENQLNNPDQVHASQIVVYRFVNTLANEGFIIQTEKDESSSRGRGSVSFTFRRWLTLLGRGVQDFNFERHVEPLSGLERDLGEFQQPNIFPARLYLKPAILTTRANREEWQNQAQQANDLLRISLSSAYKSVDSIEQLKSELELADTTEKRGDLFRTFICKCNDSNEFLRIVQDYRDEFLDFKLYLFIQNSLLNSSFETLFHTLIENPDSACRIDFLAKYYRELDPDKFYRLSFDILDVLQEEPIIDTLYRHFPDNFNHNFILQMTNLSNFSGNSQKTIFSGLFRDNPDFLNEMNDSAFLTIKYLDLDEQLQEIIYNSDRFKIIILDMPIKLLSDLNFYLFHMDSLLFVFENRIKEMTENNHIFDDKQLVKFPIDMIIQENFDLFENTFLGFFKDLLESVNSNNTDFSFRDYCLFARKSLINTLAQIDNSYLTLIFAWLPQIIEKLNSKYIKQYECVIVPTLIALRYHIMRICFELNGDTIQFSKIDIDLEGILASTSQYIHSRPSLELTKISDYEFGKIFLREYSEHFIPSSRESNLSDGYALINILHMLRSNIKLYGYTIDRENHPRIDLAITFAVEAMYKRPFVYENDLMLILLFLNSIPPRESESLLIKFPVENSRLELIKYFSMFLPREAYLRLNPNKLSHDWIRTWLTRLKGLTEASKTQRPNRSQVFELEFAGFFQKIDPKSITEWMILNFTKYLSNYQVSLLELETLGYEVIERLITCAEVRIYLTDQQIEKLQLRELTPILIKCVIELKRLQLFYIDVIRSIDITALGPEIYPEFLNYIIIKDGSEEKRVMEFVRPEQVECINPMCLLSESIFTFFSFSAQHINFSLLDFSVPTESSARILRALIRSGNFSNLTPEQMRNINLTQKQQMVKIKPPNESKPVETIDWLVSNEKFLSVVSNGKLAVDELNLLSTWNANHMKSIEEFANIFLTYMCYRCARLELNVKIVRHLFLIMKDTFSVPLIRYWRKLMWPSGNFSKMAFSVSMQLLLGKIDQSNLDILAQKYGIEGKLLAFEILMSSKAKSKHSNHHKDISEKTLIDILDEVPEDYFQKTLPYSASFYVFAIKERCVLTLKMADYLTRQIDLLRLEGKQLKDICKDFPIVFVEDENLNLRLKFSGFDIPRKIQFILDIKNLISLGIIQDFDCSYFMSEILSNLTLEYLDNRVIENPENLNQCLQICKLLLRNNFVKSIAIFQFIQKHGNFYESCDSQTIINAFTCDDFIAEFMRLNSPSKLKFICKCLELVILRDILSPNLSERMFGIRGLIDEFTFTILHREQNRVGCIQLCQQLLMCDHISIPMIQFLYQMRNDPSEYIDETCLLSDLINIGPFRDEFERMNSRIVLSFMCRFDIFKYERYVEVFMLIQRFASRLTIEVLRLQQNRQTCLEFCENCFKRAIINFPIMAFILENNGNFDIDFVQTHPVSPDPAIMISAIFSNRSFLDIFSEEQNRDKCIQFCQQLLMRGHILIPLIRFLYEMGDDPFEYINESDLLILLKDNPVFIRTFYEMNIQFILNFMYRFHLEKYTEHAERSIFFETFISQLTIEMLRLQQNRRACLEFCENCFRHARLKFPIMVFILENNGNFDIDFVQTHNMSSNRTTMLSNIFNNRHSLDVLSEEQNRIGCIQLCQRLLMRGYILIPMIKFLCEMRNDPYEHVDKSTLLIHLRGLAFREAFYGMDTQITLNFMCKFCIEEYGTIGTQPFENFISRLTIEMLRSQQNQRECLSFCEACFRNGAICVPIIVFILENNGSFVTDFFVIHPKENFVHLFENQFSQLDTRTKISIIPLILDIHEYLKSAGATIDPYIKHLLSIIFVKIYGQITSDDFTQYGNLDTNIIMFIKTLSLLPSSTILTISKYQTLGHALFSSILKIIDKFYNENTQLNNESVKNLINLVEALHLSGYYVDRQEFLNILKILKLREKIDNLETKTRDFINNAFIRYFSWENVSSFIIEDYNSLREILINFKNPSTQLSIMEKLDAAHRSSANNEITSKIQKLSEELDIPLYFSDEQTESNIAAGGIALASLVAAPIALCLGNLMWPCAMMIGVLPLILFSAIILKNISDNNYLNRNQKIFMRSLLILTALTSSIAIGLSFFKLISFSAALAPIIISFAFFAISLAVSYFKSRNKNTTSLETRTI
ncbi:MAG: hypothetical protein LBJ93_01095 [Clostridiales bacterium]|nr:hypothetical protein [Clostridiales bacterium]